MHPFTLSRPTDVSAAIATHAQNAQLAFIAGGTDLIGLMKDRVTLPDHLLDINRLAGMSQIEALRDGGLRIGALARMSDVAANPDVRSRFPVIAESLPPTVQYYGKMAMQITELLQRVHAGDQQALNIVIPMVYDELKKLAAGHLRREGKPRPLDTTALVHEAFLRLAHGQHPSYESRSHFYGIASRLMRQVLVDLARARSRDKRSAMEEVRLAEIPDLGHQPDESILAMDEALDRLGRTGPLKGHVVEMG